MPEYYWDKKIDYLKNSRWLYHNDDYLEFLVSKVWKIEKPVKIVDYGCGYGYLGLKLLPLLPQGSEYTGIDQGNDLIKEANELFKNTPYKASFIKEDISKPFKANKYDIALCHAVLLHMKDPKLILKNFINSVKNKGIIICFEPHWIGAMANYALNDSEISKTVNLNNLLKLYENSDKFGNIGIRLPILLSQLGVINVECRVSDKVNFLNQNSNQDYKNKLYKALKDDGMGVKPSDKEQFVKNLCSRGLTQKQAEAEYEVECSFAQSFDIASWFVYAPNMKISFGTVIK